MGAKSLIDKMIGSLARVPSDFMRDQNSKMSTGRGSRLRCRIAIAAMPLRFDDSAGITVVNRTHLGRRTPSVRSGRDYRLPAAIDLAAGLQRIAALPLATSPRAQAHAQRPKDCLPASVAQLNRGLEQRRRQRPIMQATFVESGAIETGCR